MAASHSDQFYPFGRIVYMADERSSTGALVSIVCREQATVRRGAFVDYTRRLCQHVLDRAPKSLVELAGQDWSYEGGTVEQAQQRFASELGDVVRVAELERFENPEGLVWGFTRPDGSAGVMLSLTTEADPEEARRAALHVAGLVLLDPIGDCGVSEGGELCMEFDPLALASRAWKEGQEGTVQEALIERLGDGSRIERFVCFRVGSGAAAD